MALLQQRELAGDNLELVVPLDGEPPPPNQPPIEKEPLEPSVELNPSVNTPVADQVKANQTIEAEIVSKTASIRRTPRRSFTTEFKLECVEHAEKTKNKTETARVFNVNRRRVQEWCMQKEKLMSIPKQQKRLSGGGRRQAALDTLSDTLPNTDGFKLSSAGNEVLTTPIEATSNLDIIHETPELCKIKHADEVSQTLPVHVDTPDFSIMDSIIRGLSVADPSILPASMVKLIQDLSTEVSSQDAKASVESIIRDASIETFLQKCIDASSIQTPMVESVEGGEATITDQGIQAAGMIQDMDTLTHSYENIPLSMASKSVDSVIISDQQKTAVQETDLGTCREETSAVQHSTFNVEAPEENSTMDTVNHGAATLNEDVTVQAAILDAFIHVASSVQVAANDQSQLIGNTDTIGSTEQLSSTPDIATQTESEVDKPSTVESTPLTIRSKVKKYYTVEFKLSCVAYAEATSKCAAARQFKVDRRRVQDWCSQKEKLQKLVDDSALQVGGGRKPADVDIEKQLVSWIKQQQGENKHLTRRMVGEEAVRLYREKGNTVFNASVGWVARFMIRNGISLVSHSLSQQLTAPITEGTGTTNGSTSSDNLD